jgi:heat shock protein HslJ
VLTAADPAIDVPVDARVTLEVVADEDAWQVGGTATCNSSSGSVVTHGTGGQGDGYGRTDMACEEPRMTIEQAHLAALTAVDAWSRPSADELVLTGPEVTLRFTALPPVPTADLTGTSWVLDGLSAGSGTEADAAVSSPAAGADEATLRLEPEGTMAASTGCRTFSGEWVATGDEVLLTTWGVRADSPNVAGDGSTTCDEAVVAQEDHVLSVLGDGFRAEIDGRQLTLITRDGLRLSCRSVPGD